MKLRRVLFNLLSAISALLFVATAELSVRSYWIGDIIRCFTTHSDRTPANYISRFYMVGLAGGKIQLHYGVQRGTPPYIPDTFWQKHPTGTQFWSYEGPATYDRADHLGFHWSSSTIASPGTVVIERILRFPSWLVAVFFLILPAAFAGRRYRSRRRLGQGLCTACGYDLRATPDRCPECGAVNAGKIKGSRQLIDRSAAAGE